MRKLILFSVFSLFALTTYGQGNFNLGINLGLPLGDIKDGYSLNLAVEGNYLWNVSPEFDAGFAFGYNHYIGDTYFGFDVEDAGFLPIAASGRFNISEKFVLGADLGYAVGLSPSGNDGGFYFAPKFQYAIGQTIDLVLVYKGISLSGDGSGTFESINLGVEFGL